MVDHDLTWIGIESNFSMSGSFAQIIAAPELYNVAKASYKRIASGQSSDIKSDALISCIFAAATVEAFVNSLAVTTASPDWVIPAQLRSLPPRLMKLEEDGKKSTQAKIMAVGVILNGAEYDKGKSPYQDFALLFQLRNALMHLKADEQSLVDFAKQQISPQRPLIIEQLRSRNILAPESPDNLSSWISLLADEKVAKWACNAAANMVQEVINDLPDTDNGTPAYIKMSAMLQYCAIWPVDDSYESNPAIPGTKPLDQSGD